MKKEINNTTINTTEINTQEENTMKTFELKKFEDEDRYNRPELLTALYETREKFINAFDELYVTGKIEESVEYKKDVKTFLQISQYQKISGRLDKIVRKPMELCIQESSDIMTSYMTEFINSAYVWEDLLRETIKKEILSTNDITYIAGKILRTVREAMRIGTFDSYGRYKIEKIPYGEYKGKCPERQIWTIFDENTIELNPLAFGPRSCLKKAYLKTGAYDYRTATIEVYMAASEEQRKIGVFGISIGQENPNSCSAICRDSVIAAVRAYYHPQNREIFGCQLIKWLDDAGFTAEREAAEFVLGRGEDFTKNEQMLVKFYSMQSEEFFDDRFSVEHMLQQMAEDLRQLKSEKAAEDTETTKNSKKQEEKEMAKYNKKQDVIDRVVSTYEVVGRERTIHNCEGLDDDNDIEIFGRRDITVLAAEYIFGRSDAEAAENEQLLVSYYESQPERFFERLKTDDILGERLVIRMADDLLDAKTQGAKLDEADRHMCGLNDRYSIRLYRAEFLNTYRKLDIRDDEMENYLANFQTQATAWDHMMSWDYPESGWRFLMNKFYGSDEGARYNWVDHVTDMVTWLRELMEIATVCGTYSPDNSYRAIDYTGYDEFCLETLDVRNSVEEKIHSYESRHPYAAPVPVRFEDVKEFVIKFRYVDLMKITDEIDQEISGRPAWFRDEYGLTTGYYRAV